jgi:hypothetical protein
VDAETAAAEEELAAARRLVHELPAGAADRRVLFRLYVAGEDAERIRTDLGLDAERYDRILARAQQRFKELRPHNPITPLDPAAGLRPGLIRLAAREAAGEAAAVREGLLARFQSPGAIVALIILLLAAVAAAGLLELRAYRLRKALDEARITSPPRPVEPSAALEAQLREARRALDDEKVRAAERIEKERRQRDQLAANLERLNRPQINTPLLPLERNRSLPIALPRSPGWMVLSLDLEGAAAASSYSASLLAPGGARLWNSAGLVPNRWRALVISFPSTLLKPGDFQIRVEAIPLKGAPVPAGRYSFRVER